MSASFTHHNLDGILRMLAPATNYWTLHGGGAVVYFLQHRPLVELDIFMDRANWDERGAAITTECLRPIASSDMLEEIKNKFPADRKALSDIEAAHTITCLVVKCEKIQFSFIYLPKNSGIKKKIIHRGKLPVASFDEVMGCKLYALHDRDVFNDYFDMATALERGYALEPMLQLMQQSLVTEIDHSLPFRKMITPPEFIASQLSGKHAKVLKEAGVFGLTLLENNSPDSCPGL